MAALAGSGAAPLPPSRAAFGPVGIGRAALVLLAFASTLVVPIAVFAAGTAYRLEYLAVSWYVPHEELRQAFRTLSARAMLEAPLVFVDLATGHAVSAVYRLQVGQLVFATLFSALLGALAGASPDRRTSDGPACALGVAGVTASVCGASTMLLGCCGGGMPGAALALLGLGTLVASDIATYAPILQAGLLAGLSLVLLRRRASLSGRGPAAVGIAPVRQTRSPA